MTTRRRPGRIQRSLARLERKGIEVVTGEIEELNPGARRVRVNGTDLTGDAVIVSLGADLAPETVPGLREAGHNLYTLEGATGVRDALGSFTRGRVVVLTATPWLLHRDGSWAGRLRVRGFLRLPLTRNATLPARSTLALGKDPLREAVALDGVLRMSETSESSRPENCTGDTRPEFGSGRLGRGSEVPRVTRAKG